MEHNGNTAGNQPRSSKASLDCLEEKRRHKQHASLHDVPRVFAHDGESLSVLRALQAQEIARASRVTDQVVRVQGRIRAILAVLTHDHGRQCLTDDGETYIGLLLPHYVELANLSDRMSFPEAVARIRGWLPVSYQTRGAAWFEAEWARLSVLRSVALSSRDSNPKRRDDAYVWWLPSAATISAELNLTRARRDAVNRMYLAHGDSAPIRGLPAVDPLSTDEAREVDRLRKENERRAKGVRPQTSRSRTADEAAFRESLGISFGRWYRATKAGPDAVLTLVLKAGGSGRVADKMCPADIYSYGVDTNYPLRNEDDEMLKIETVAGETRDLMERFRVVKADYLKGPAIKPTIPKRLLAKVGVMQLAIAA